MPRAGQAVLEYAVLVSLAIAAIVGMQVYAKRGLQAGIKKAADQMSPFADDAQGEKAQAEGMRYESGERRNRVAAAPGDVLEQQAKVKNTVDRTVQEREESDGSYTRTIQQDVATTSGELGGGVSSVSQVVAEKR